MGLWWGKNLWLRVTTAGAQCLHLSECYFHLFVVFPSEWLITWLNVLTDKCASCAFQLYGPGAVFYKLSTVCLETSTGKYTYSVCPFGPSKQTERGHSQLVIGSQPRWLDRGPNIFRLLLDNGDSINCPAGKYRQTTVSAFCFVFLQSSFLGFV